MTGRTISIGGSENVMAALGSGGHYYEGKWLDVLVTQIGKDEDTPLEIRKSLVGLTVPTIFSKEQLTEAGVNLPIPDGSRIAYCEDIVKILDSNGKDEGARQLRETISNPCDMYVFEEGVYQL